MTFPVLLKDGRNYYWRCKLEVINMTTPSERQALRHKFLKILREMRTEAYCGLPSIEYDAIRVLIDYFEAMVNEHKND